MLKKTFRKVAVLMGGDSPEAAVSRMSGKAVLEALRSRGYEAIPVEAGPDLFHTLLRTSPDVCFLATHGGHGENGALQGCLEVLGIPYTGSGVLGSALGMSKSASRALFRQGGLDVPETVAIESGERLTPDKIPFPLPFMVKPESAGSSIGVTRVDHFSDLPQALLEAEKHSSRILVEPFLPGREVQSAILDGRYLGAIEIVPDSSEPFYTYASKYQKGKSRHIFPAPLTSDVASRLEEATLRAFGLLELRGVARMDTLVLPDGRVVVLEMNTLPGLTETSLVPEIARGCGLSFEDLVETILSSARLDTPAPTPVC
ncbi:D-alanine--D-alanine ligase [Leptospirillum ferriphilum]|uniref:D-alanine--D-alanine ligase n=1 Tax=Leptospirillum ferriphilum TaxID=178606 RepID=UPI0009855207|nr:D-alanine--D-alanine ligase [Leptospirillum ferriphilum]